MEQYIADKKIITVAIKEKKTPAGLEIVEVFFEDNTSLVMPKKRFELVVSDEKKDASYVQDMVKNHIGSVLYSTILEYGVNWGEVNMVGDMMVEFVNEGFKKASDVLWGKEKELISLIEINSILVENYDRQNKDNNESSSVGGGADTENKE